MTGRPRGSGLPGHTYPAAVAIAGTLIRSAGPAPFFPIAGSALILVTLLGGMRRELREFGTASSEPTDDLAAGPVPA